MQDIVGSKNQETLHLDQFIKTTEKAAFGAFLFVGKGDKIAADRGAVDLMRNELNKIENYCKDRSKVSLEDIIKLTNLAENYHVSELTDICLSKNTKKTANGKIPVGVGFGVSTEKDVQKYQLFSKVTDIYLFDSKGYEKSMSFDHSLIEKVKINKPLMIAGNIQVNDNLDNYKKIADIIDISGGLETSGVKDKSKIDIFLNKIEQVKNET